MAFLECSSIISSGIFSYILNNLLEILVVVPRPPSTTGNVLVFSSHLQTMQTAIVALDDGFLYLCAIRVLDFLSGNRG